jgi:branched-chain amino acid transport system ATP-binding protein
LTSLLSCEGLTVGYGGRPVVRGFDFQLAGGEIVALIGPNGAGKSTLMSTIAGQLRALSGHVLLEGRDVSGFAPDRRTRAGLILVPESRALFGSLTARENLQLASRKGCLPIDDVVDLFPQLGPRLDIRAAVLSGGEQQMLAIARAVIQRPRVLLVDEMTIGLSPQNGERVAERVRQSALATGTAVLLVEQHLDLALRTAERAIVLVHGSIALQDSTAALRHDVARVHSAYFGANATQEPLHGDEAGGRSRLASDTSAPAKDLAG